jgi:hypothetical protein
MRIRRSATWSAAAVLLALPAASGCSDAEDDAQGIATADKSSGVSTTEESGDDSDQEAASDTGTGGDSAGVVAPIMIDGPDAVEVTVGNALDVITENVTEVKTDNPEVLEVSQPSDDGSAQFNAGATVVGAGEATLSVYGEGGEKLYEVVVTAEG